MLKNLFASVVLGISLVSAKNFDVVVGQNGADTFTPDHVTGAVATDTITFQFSGFHSAVESTLANPCTRKSGGFSSGQVSSGTFQITLNSTDPTWVHCDVANHCRIGMVFAVNPGNDLATFQAVAQGQTPPSSTGSSSTGTQGSSTGTQAPMGSSTGSQSASSTRASTSSPGAGFASIDANGVVLGAAGFLGLAAMLF